MHVMTPTQAAEVLSVKERTILEWARTGKLTGSRTPAGWRFTDRDIERFLDSQRPAKKTETTP